MAAEDVAAARALPTTAAATPVVNRPENNQNQTSASASAAPTPAAPLAAAPSAVPSAFHKPLAARWPPLSKRLARKEAAVCGARASAAAAYGRVAKAILADDAAGEEAAKKTLGAADEARIKAKQALEEERARRARLREAGLLDPRTGDALGGGGAPGGLSALLSGLPYDMITEVFWRLPRNFVVNVVPFVCSDWAQIPLAVRTCCESATVRFGSGSPQPAFPWPGFPRRRLTPDAAALDFRLNERNRTGGGGRVRVSREALSNTLGAAPRLAELSVKLDLDQLPMLAECLGGARGGASSSSLRRLSLGLSCPAGESAALTDASVEAMGAALAAGAPGLEFLEVRTHAPWAHAEGYGPAGTLLLSLLASSAGAGSDGGGGGGSGGGDGGSKGSGGSDNCGGGNNKLRELSSSGQILTSGLIASLEGSFAIRKIIFLHGGGDHPGFFVPRFLPRGVSRTLRELHFEVRMVASAGDNPQGGRGRRGPIDAYCDAEGVSAAEALAPLAGAVTRLVLDLGYGAGLPQVLRLPGCLRALKGVRSLAVRYPRTVKGYMEMAAETATAEAAATAAAAAAGGGANIVFAKALRSSLRRRGAAPQPWDLLSSLTELDVRFLLGNYELVLPRSGGMPNLRRLDMRGMMPETPRSYAAANAETQHHYLPPSPAAVPNLRWLGIGFQRSAARESPHALDLSGLVPAGSFQPYRHLRSLLIEGATINVKGGSGGNGGGGNGGDNEDEEVRRLVGAFPLVFPALRMIHLHNCSLESAAERVLENLADVYKLLGAAASAGARGGSATGGAAASSSSAGASPFRGVCRGCPAWSFSMEPSGDYFVKISEER